MPCLSGVRPEEASLKNWEAGPRERPRDSNLAHLLLLTSASTPQMFVHERLNGYYTSSMFVVANSICAIPFLWIMAILSTLIVYWLSNLNYSGDNVPCFFVNREWSDIASPLFLTFSFG